MLNLETVKMMRQKAFKFVIRLFRDKYDLFLTTHKRRPVPF